MSAPSASINNFVSEQKLAVSFRLVLSLYWIIPLALVLQGLDQFFWQNYLKSSLPSSPYHFVLFQILFGTPHVVASNILLVSNKEYVIHFRRQIMTMTAAIAIAYVLGNMLLPYRFLYACVAGWTVFHVLKQQYGIARGLCQLPENVFKLLLWLSVFAGLAIYLGIFIRSGLTAEEALWIKWAASAGCLLLLVAAVVNRHWPTTAFGKQFYWANIFLVLTSFYLYVQEQYFMAILVPRFVHDATAYVFYVTHDYNKHRRQPQNALYRAAAKINCHIFIVLPVLSFALAFVLQAYGDEWINWLTRHLFGVEFYKVITLAFLGYLGLMHYYMEGLTWQKDSPYRQYIAFTK
ncbi:MAG: hypothetical protein FJ190_09275 [Gammaproteobacteria bacterium]|nr:hypothetical protein [Gammaproteobacteria bacterium]